MEAREVALLLTDVEASTALLVRQGQAGVAALGRVAELVSEAARRHDGWVSTTQGEGDSAVVVFASVPRAVAAALELNELMAAERWPVGEQVSVRSAVHVGEVTASQQGLFGAEVHRCARLRALADGGEVIVSDAAARSVGEHLPGNSSLSDEGSVLLRGFGQPERVWRLVHAGLRRRHGPLRGVAATPAALPEWRTSLVGRSAEIASVAARLGAGRVVTLVGPAGVGKTRLAAAAASESPLRAVFVDLTRATSDDEVHAIAAEAFAADPASPPLAGIEAVLLAAPALIVVDNCEHVVDAASSLVDHVVARCPTSAVLATSRAALRVPGEDVVAVSPLPTAQDGAAVALFVDRARAARGDLITDNEVLGQIALITSLLDGVPLAIELAAVRVTAFSVSELLALLQDDLANLGDTHRRGPDRHRTLRAAIEWSMRMVGEEERAVLCRLAVLPGSFRLATALAVTDPAQGGGRTVIAALPSLIEQSLIVTEHETGSTRYRLLEMIRAVGQDALTEAERTGVLDRLLAHCLGEVAGIEGHDFPAAGVGSEVTRDHALYAAAVEHALETEQTELGLRLVYDLFEVWDGTTQRLTLDRWMAALVAQAQAPSPMRGMVLRRQAIIASVYQADHHRPALLLDAAEADAIAVSDRQLLGRVRATRADIDLFRGRMEGLEARLVDAVALLEETGDAYVADALTTLSELYIFRARFDQADELLTRAAAANPLWYARILIELNRAWCALMAGRIEAAASHAATSLDLAERSGNTDLTAYTIEIAAYSALARGETALARELFVRMLAFARQHDLPHLTEALAGQAIVSVLCGDLTVARSCRTELHGRKDGVAEMLPYRHLACAFVDLADGKAEGAAAGAEEVRAAAELRGQPYAHLLSLELLAASIATDDPQRARELLTAADEERAAVGATAWPLEPYRLFAVRILDALTPDRPSSPPA